MLSSKKFDNFLFVPKYENSSTMPGYICTKPCSGKIISQIIKWITGVLLYQTSDTENHKLVKLHDFDGT